MMLLFRSMFVFITIMFSNCESVMNGYETKLRGMITISAYFTHFFSLIDGNFVLINTL